VVVPLQRHRRGERAADRGSARIVDDHRARGAPGGIPQRGQGVTRAHPAHLVDGPGPGQRRGVLVDDRPSEAEHGAKGRDGIPDRAFGSGRRAPVRGRHEEAGGARGEETLLAVPGRPCLFEVGPVALQGKRVVPPEVVGAQGQRAVGRVQPGMAQEPAPAGGPGHVFDGGLPHHGLGGWHLVGAVHARHEGPEVGGEDGDGQPAPGGRGGPHRPDQEGGGQGEQDGQPRVVGPRLQEGGHRDRPRQRRRRGQEPHAPGPGRAARDPVEAEAGEDGHREVGHEQPARGHAQAAHARQRGGEVVQGRGAPEREQHGQPCRGQEEEDVAPAAAAARSEGRAGERDHPDVERRLLEEGPRTERARPSPREGQEGLAQRRRGEGPVGGLEARGCSGAANRGLGHLVQRQEVDGGQPRRHRGHQAGGDRRVARGGSAAQGVGSHPERRHRPRHERHLRVPGQPLRGPGRPGQQPAGRPALTESRLQPPQDHGQPRHRGHGVQVRHVADHEAPVGEGQRAQEGGGDAHPQQPGEAHRGEDRERVAEHDGEGGEEPGRHHRHEPVERVVGAHLALGEEGIAGEEARVPGQGAEVGGADALAQEAEQRHHERREVAPPVHDAAADGGPGEEEDGAGADEQVDVPPWPRAARGGRRRGREWGAHHGRLEERAS
jgi:hypothetical protein